MPKNNAKEQADSWEKLWKKKSLRNLLISVGRGIYNRPFTRLLRKYLTPESRLLEVGCGTSAHSLSIAAGIREFVGLDISESAIRLSKENAERMKLKNCSFVKGNCFALPFPDNSFDVVWSQGLVQSFPNPEGIIREHYRACKQKGNVIVTVPSSFSYLHLWHFLTRPSFMRRFWPWPDHGFYTKERLEKLGRLFAARPDVFSLGPLLGVLVLRMRK